MYWIFAIGGYVGALHDRVLLVPDRLPGRRRRRRARRRRSSRAGPRAPRASRRNPPTGEPEDTDVGFPGAEHHIAEREWPMKIAMAVLGVRRPVRRPGPDPGRRPTWSTTFLERHLRGLVAVPRSCPRPRDAWIGLAVGGADLDRRDRRSPTCSTSAGPGSRRGCAERLRAPARLPASTSGTSTSSSTSSSTGPAIAIGRFANAVFERVVVDGIVTGADRRSSGRRRAWSAAPSPGFVRAYALLLLGGFAALGLYFLVVDAC